MLSNSAEMHRRSLATYRHPVCGEAALQAQEILMEANLLFAPNSSSLFSTDNVSAAGVNI